MRDSDEEPKKLFYAASQLGTRDGQGHALNVAHAEKRRLSGGYEQDHIRAGRKQTEHGGGRHIGQTLADYYSGGETPDKIESLRGRATLNDAHYSHVRDEAAQLSAYLVGRRSYNNIAHRLSLPRGATYALKISSPERSL